MQKIIDHVLSNINLNNFDDGDFCFKIDIPIDIHPVIKKRFEIEDKHFEMQDQTLVLDIFEEFDNLTKQVEESLLTNQQLLKNIRYTFMHGRKAKILRIDIADYSMDVEVTNKIVGLTAAEINREDKSDEGAGETIEKTVNEEDAIISKETLTSSLRAEIFIKS